MSKKKIFLIEDEKTLRFLMAQTLTGEGFEVYEAADGEEGIQKLQSLKENKPDLILLDLLLPGINGFEVLAKIKSDSDLESIPVVILSNLGQEEEIQRGLKLGAIDFLIKAHFTLDEILARVQKFL